MNFNQVREYTTTLLKGLFPNIKTLKALSESENGNLTFNGDEVDKPAMIHYSTEEQIVGYWIDGRYLYQKTLITKTPSSVTWQTWEDLTKQVNQTISGYENIRKVSGFVVGSDKSATTILMLYNEYDAYSGFTLLPYENIIRGRVGSYGINGTAYVTIQYTKTTDEPTVQLLSESEVDN